MSCIVIADSRQLCIAFRGLISLPSDRQKFLGARALAEAKAGSKTGPWQRLAQGLPQRLVGWASFQRSKRAGGTSDGGVISIDQKANQLGAARWRCRFRHNFA
jgi:hypothetical protein